ncbi:34-kDa subunit of RNA polymerase III (C) [Aspergillus tubingensis]|uniref:DNA-directed RNA polymerase III subunit RPC6 n=2 Tax=Aspergillus subgen. Circumdati TaxID=2720871 RepID=A0A100ISD0_ASPNG|nr:DNA-directed RNA polymerase III subunit Rpc34 [Aspergillus tubingensis]GAQ46420.1 DNA-directed RNA polymerase III subunit Rpc34 [Aspergillus niger]GFN13894.1 DNA-directed RNA polymerase III subunit Rpc34 [Aspergillus tubingensis]GLA63744.1 34-kDa subunit of RNA polymerase III (C) [Aspergillus tubingensis]GLA74242.1 34-kDa subunit of RNA polymerase III (C) [Aspergillus tubingensis]GLA80811.1 34-kDa subunit of RNA polymerase III (C) [Aspergillus tubingensis]
MASAGPSGSSVNELASRLYDACVNQFPSDHLFYQQDLLGLNIVPKNDLALLLSCAQSLVNQKLFRLLQGKNDRLAWKIISRDDAEKLRDLSPDESLVYNVIHSTGRSGIWVRAIGNRTNLHKSILDRCLKSLETKSYIKSVHNVKFPSRKMYMLANLAPSEDVTGGAWFTDGVLDENFINSVAGFIEYSVSRKSWYEAPSSDGPRNKRMKTADGGVAVKQEGAPKEYLPFPAGYQGYPTIPQLTAAVNESGITPVRLGEESITQLLEMLCYDNKLVSLNNGEFYKSVKNPEQVKSQQARKPRTDDSGIDDRLVKNGMTEAPCGNCPVFKLCAPGGAVSPESCEYFDPWLEKALGF